MSTAILQSSSATTVAAVGFVGAGLMSFPQALGIVFGANLGTTITGWLVALLGFKLQLGTVVMPFIFLGVFLRLFAKGRAAQVGYAIAGFGLIFVGIAVLQQAMAGMGNIISPDRLPTDTFTGRLALVGIGVVVTIITQSSSAGVAAALTALNAGAINIEQAAALVIGMDVGTTVTAAIATIGGSSGARRTGFSHVIYNLITAVGALLLVTPYIAIWDWASPGALYNNAEVALVGFHSTFNLLGVLIVLPFTEHFAVFIERLIPAKTQGISNRLDRALLEQPALALSAVQANVQAELVALLGHVQAILGRGDEGLRVDLQELQSVLDSTHHYIDHIHLNEAQGAEWQRLVALIHSLDHLQRLHERCEEEGDRAFTAKNTPGLSQQTQLLLSTIEELLPLIKAKEWAKAAQVTRQTNYEIHTIKPEYRASVMAGIATGELGVHEGTGYLQAIRWLDRVSAHLARICARLNESVINAAQGG